MEEMNITPLACGLCAGTSGQMWALFFVRDHSEVAVRFCRKGPTVLEGHPELDCGVASGS